VEVKLSTFCGTMGTIEHKNVYLMQIANVLPLLSWVCHRAICCGSGLIVKHFNVSSFASVVLMDVQVTFICHPHVHSIGCLWCMCPSQFSVLLALASSCIVWGTHKPLTDIDSTLKPVFATYHH